MSFIMYLRSYKVLDVMVRDFEPGDLAQVWAMVRASQTGIVLAKDLLRSTVTIKWQLHTIYHVPNLCHVRIYMHATVHMWWSEAWRQRDSSFRATLAYGVPSRVYTWHDYKGSLASLVLARVAL